MEKVDFYRSISLSGSGSGFRIRIQQGNLNPDPTGSETLTLGSVLPEGGGVWGDGVQPRVGEGAEGGVGRAVVTRLQRRARSVRYLHIRTTYIGNYRRYVETVVEYTIEIITYDYSG